MLRPRLRAIQRSHFSLPLSFQPTAASGPAGAPGLRCGQGALNYTMSICVSEALRLGCVTSGKLLCLSGPTSYGCFYTTSACLSLIQGALALYAISPASSKSAQTWLPEPLLPHALWPNNISLSPHSALLCKSGRPGTQLCNPGLPSAEAAGVVAPCGGGGWGGGTPLFSSAPHSGPTFPCV